jgi:hypothetical protein
VSFRAGSIVDAVITTLGSDATGGRFTVRVPAVAAAGDVVALLAVGVGFDGSLAYVVADPGYPASGADQNVYDTMVFRPMPRIWAWSFALTSIVDGDTLRITEPLGSGAARVFDYLRYVYTITDTFFLPSAPQSLVAWLGTGTTWSCGACQVAAPTSEFGLDFRHQAFIAGGPSAGYWSDAVTSHEFGHYAMAAYGRVVGEGGPHSLGVPTNPGQAWSEGWATFFSSDVRSSSRYYDKQDGFFFWLDLAARTYSGGVPWARARASDGLFQLMDENEVAATLLVLEGGLGRDAMWSALADPRMTVGPFERGYYRRTWPGEPSPRPAEFTETPDSTTCLADYLDALVCADASRRAAIDSATEPATRYPFPSGSPLCR